MAKQTKLPAARKDLNGDQKNLLDQIDDQWKNHPFVENYHGRWEEYIAWFEGDQYKLYNEYSQTLEDVAPLIERETKNVYNRIMPLVRQQWGSLRYPHEFYVIPNTTEAEDVRSAYVGSQLIEFTNENRKFQRKVNYAKLWALITGICYWKEWWNKNIPATARGSGKKTVAVKGDIDYDYVCPFNCRPDPYSQSREDWRWFIEGKRVPRKVVEDEFKLEADTLPTMSKDRTTWNTHLFERQSIGVHAYNQVLKDEVIRKEYWMTPTEEFPAGKFLVVVEDWLLWESENPAARHQLPYFGIPGIIPILGELAHDSAVRLGQQAQRQFNRYASQIDDHIKNWKIKGMIPWGSLRPGDEEAFTRAGVDYVTYNSRFGTPYYQSPPPLPDFLATWLQFMEKEIETETSVREVSYARLPKYASRASGVLFEGLKQQDESVLFPTIEEIDGILQEAVSYRLELIQKHYNEERLVKTVGRNRQHTISYFSGSDLRDNRDVRVVPGVDILTSRTKKEQIVTALVEKGFIQDPRKAFEMLGIKTVEEFWEDEFTDERQAYRQLEIMKEGGTYIAPNPHDNHEVMYEIFNRARKAEDFETLPQEAQNNILRRLEEEQSFVGVGAEIVQEGEQPTNGQPVEEPVPGVPVAAPGIPGAIAPGASPNPPVTPEEVLQAIMNQGGL